jgi:hypothetical protein
MIGIVKISNILVNHFADNCKMLRRNLPILLVIWYFVRLYCFEILLNFAL